MEKHPFTYAYLLAIAAAFLGEFGTRGLDAMSGTIIQWGWCGAKSNTCLFAFQFATLAILFGIVVSIDTLILRQKDWTKVSFSEWTPLDPNILGGVKIKNDSSVDLEDCEIDLVRYESDRESEPKIAEMAGEMLLIMERSGHLPNKLFWFDKRREPKAIERIGRGKEGYVMLLFPVNEGTQVMGRKPTYQIQTDGIAYVEPILRGWLHLRILARVKGSPLPMQKISVRLEVENDTPLIRKIIKGEP